MAQKPESKEGLASSLRKAAPYINLSYSLIASMGILGYLGWLADEKFMTKPLWLLIGLFLGFGIGMYQFYKFIQNIERGEK